jgi:hypothetical protein
MQQGYIVPDIQAGLQHWLMRGVGPFYLIAPFKLDALHYGEPTEVHMTAAFACSGDQQIELIEPMPETGPNIYSDYLRENPKGGLQHLAVWADDVDAKLDELSAKGCEYILAQRYPGSHAYLDMPRSPGVMIQLMPAIPRYLGLFNASKEAAASWDGKSDPVQPMPDAVRLLDWAHPV